MALPNKQSYDGLNGEMVDYKDPENPTYDLPAECSNELRADTAAMTATCDIVFFTFTTDGANMFVTMHDSVYGNDISYIPIGLYNSVGDYDFTLPASVVDARGKTKYLNLRCGYGNTDYLYGLVSVKITSANTIKVILTDSSGPSQSDPPNPTDKITIFLK
jgi:hypothetical protein